ncbi:hypothetical protein [Amycolatopsis sp. NPDC059021]|uniref:hypothetical protein n=1 Tax=Amycolatopsis sp. NPDC059021 TaxID=3346704 RepID=UPI00366E653B
MGTRIMLGLPAGKHARLHIGHRMLRATTELWAAGRFVRPVVALAVCGACALFVMGMLVGVSL